ncbi:MAG: hypothetical protein EPO31_09670 [Gammaproteobacteria bacterium]|jgi:hypothetical protein|nr:MAG: hypothetical protein EPO31_09670 [Gammaproteobacteria bacterium]
MIHVRLPYHLQTLARISADIDLEVAGPVSPNTILNALEERFPMLRGTIRDHITKERRPLIRFFACAEDYSHLPPDTPLPEAIRSGAETFIILGAIAGG